MNPPSRIPPTPPALTSPERVASCPHPPFHSDVRQPDGHFGKSQDRAKIKGSPVVPGSSEKLYEDGESALYTVTILKGQYEAGFYEGDSFQQVRGHEYRCM